MFLLGLGGGEVKDARKQQEILDQVVTPIIMHDMMLQNEHFVSRIGAFDIFRAGGGSGKIVEKQ